MPGLRVEADFGIDVSRAIGFIAVNRLEKWSGWTEAVCVLLLDSGDECWQNRLAKREEDQSLAAADEGEPAE